MCVLRAYTKVAECVWELLRSSSSWASLGKTALQGTRIGYSMEPRSNIQTWHRKLDRSNQDRHFSFLLVSYTVTVTWFFTCNNMHIALIPQNSLFCHLIMGLCRSKYHIDDLTIDTYAPILAFHWKETSELFYLAFWPAVTYTNSFICLKAGRSACCLPTEWHRNIFHASHC